MKDVEINNEIKVAGLHPAIRSSVISFLAITKKKAQLHLYITHGFRSFEEQNLIYQQGRSLPGKIVTYANSGESYHNYGLAFDVIPFEYRDNISGFNNWNLIGELGKCCGFFWGGDFLNMFDKRHFQKNFGYHHSALLKLYNAKEFENGFLKLKTY